MGEIPTMSRKEFKSEYCNDECRSDGTCPVDELTEATLASLDRAILENTGMDDSDKPVVTGEERYDNNLKVATLGLTSCVRASGYQVEEVDTNRSALSMGVTDYDLPESVRDRTLETEDGAIVLSFEKGRKLIEERRK